MEWSRNQQLALDKAGRWMSHGTDQVFHMFGYAGTGKTTLAKYLAEQVNGDVLFGAYTGKAAYVLKTKGCLGAQTLHSLIYRSKDSSKVRLKELQTELEQLHAELTFEGVEDLDNHPKIHKLRVAIKAEATNSDKPNFVLNMESPVRDAEVLIIDEVSMVDNQMGQDLLSFGTPILVLGDPAQLPPVMGEGYFTKDITPDIMLDEIHRQALDSPILRMATKVREEQFLSVGDYGDNCEVIDGKLEGDRILSYDQILLGRNRTRHATNAKIRRMLGIDGTAPVVGDKVVCRRNNSKIGILNGEIFDVEHFNGVIDDKAFMTVKSQDQDEVGGVELAAHLHYLSNEGDEPAWYEKKEAEKFEYAYGLTVHVSQGSQWNSVCLFDESFCFRKDRFKWLYTGITRAAEAITIVKMPR